MKKKITNKNEERFLPGTLVGAVLAVAGSMLRASKSENVRADIKKLSGDFYHQVSPEIKKMKNVGQTQYQALMTESAKKYAQIKKLSLAESQVLAKEAKRSWVHIKKHLA